MHKCKRRSGVDSHFHNIEYIPEMDPARNLRIFVSLALVGIRTCSKLLSILDGLERKTSHIMDLVVRHEFDRCIRKNTNERSRMALKKSSKA